MVLKAVLMATGFHGKNELEKLGVKTSVPQMPTPKNQNLKVWIKEISKLEIDDQTFLIGHSLGPAFILSLLERKPAKAAIFVAGFTGFLGIKEFDELNETFVMKNFDWDSIRQNCKNFIIINSEDDPYVPLQKGKELSKNLNSELIVVKGGHLNTESGFREFPLLLTLIKNYL